MSATIRKRENTMYHIAICDDNIESIKEIEQCLEHYKSTSECKLEITSFTNEKELLDELTHERGYEVIFLDIELGMSNGIDVAKTIVQKSPETMIVFITAYHQYIHESFQVRPIGYIEKPVKKEVVENTLRRALAAIDDLPTLNYSFKGCQHRISLKRIAYLESEGRKIIIGEVSDNSENIFYGKLNDIEKQINDVSSSFLRISQSVMINMRYIRTITYNTVTIEVDGNRKEFGISRRYKERVREKYMEFARR